MSVFTKLGVNVAAPFNADGSPRQISPQDFQIWMSEVERLIKGLLGSVGNVDLPDLIYRYIITGGNENKIVATPNATPPSAAGEALFTIEITRPNTGNVTINGRALLTSSGNQITAGGLVPGIWLFLDDGSNFRLVSDQSSQAIMDAAEQAAHSAQEARDIVENLASDVVSQGNVPIYSTLSSLAALEVPAGINAIRVNGRLVVGDGEGGLYIDTDNGSPDQGMSGGGSSRSWYRVKDIDLERIPFGPLLYSDLQSLSPAQKAVTRANMGMDSYLKGDFVQRTLSSGLTKYVLDSEDFQFHITNFTGGTAEVDARAMEPQRVYTFRVYGNDNNTLKIDLGEGAVVSGAIGAPANLRGFELLAGQSVSIIKSTENYFYVVAFYDPVFRSPAGATSWYEADVGGTWKLVRTYAVPGAVGGMDTATDHPTVLKGNSPAHLGYVRAHMTIMGIGTNDPAAFKQPYLKEVNDNRIVIHNPNIAAVTVTVEITGLRKYPTANAGNQLFSQSKLPPLEDSRALLRDYTVVLVGQSLAESYIRNSSYAGLDEGLRAAGQLAGGHYLDLINTAVGGSVADKASLTDPSSTNYWFDVAQNKDGPLLTAAIVKINAAYASGKSPKLIIFDLGQGDALALSRGINTKANYHAGMVAIINRLKLAAPSVPIYLQNFKGRREASQTAVQDIRDAQLELAKADYFNGAVEVYDIELLDNVHPTNAGYRIIGRRIGQLHSGVYQPPLIIAVTRVNNRLLRIKLSKPINLSITPIGTKIDYIGARDASNSLIRLNGIVVSDLTIDLTRNADIDNQSLRSILMPVGNNATLSAGPFVVDLDGNPIKASEVEIV